MFIQFCFIFSFKYKFFVASKPCSKKLIEYRIYRYEYTKIASCTVNSDSGLVYLTFDSVRVFFLRAKEIKPRKNFTNGSLSLSHPWKVRSSRNRTKENSFFWVMSNAYFFSERLGNFCRQTYTTDSNVCVTCVKINIVILILCFAFSKAKKNNFFCFSRIISFLLFVFVSSVFSFNMHVQMYISVGPRYSSGLTRFKSGIYTYICVYCAYFGFLFSYFNITRKMIINKQQVKNERIAPIICLTLSAFFFPSKYLLHNNFLTHVFILLTFWCTIAHFG